MNADQLFDLACRYADAAAHAPSCRVHAAYVRSLKRSPAERSTWTDCRETWASERDQLRDQLRRALSFSYPYPRPRHPDNPAPQHSAIRSLDRAHGTGGPDEPSPSTPGPSSEPLPPSTNSTR